MQQSSFFVTEQYFFDSSALVRLLLKEPGSTKVREIGIEGGFRYTSWICWAEVLGVLKRKLLEANLTEQQYGGHVSMALYYIREGRPQVLDVRSDRRRGRPVFETSDLDVIRMRHQFPELDAADALQLSAIQNSFVHLFHEHSSARLYLVSADGGLLRAARVLGYLVVDVRRD